MPSRMVWSNQYFSTVKDKVSQPDYVNCRRFYLKELGRSDGQIQPGQKLLQPAIR